MKRAVKFIFSFFPEKNQVETNYFQHDLVPRLKYRSWYPVKNMQLSPRYSFLKNIVKINFLERVAKGQIKLGLGNVFGLKLNYFVKFIDPLKTTHSYCIILRLLFNVRHLL